MRVGTSRARATAPIARSVFWLLMSLLAWELFQGLRAGAAIPEGSWAIAPVDLVFLVLLPALCAFAFTRLFLVVSQTARGTLNVYSTISSPFAWAFWVGIAVGMIGHGIHIAGHMINRALPDIFIQGEFAAKIAFLDTKAGYLLLGAGFFLSSLALLLMGQGAGQRISGPERLLFVLGSLGTYGVVFIYMGVGGGQIIPAITASVALSAVSLWTLPPSEVTRDPIGALIVPGAFLAGVTLIIWTVVVGGQPTWP
ncbi:MAG: hypothetical protein A2133_09305 [Actinobacteria bacterium RBG_16_64_13]|nr:MAG: hypothetical protein A2133_09305 [Actinobacteria bacterium RBG_16_64_13]